MIYLHITCTELNCIFQITTALTSELGKLDDYISNFEMSGPTDESNKYKEVRIYTKVNSILKSVSIML